MLMRIYCRICNESIFNKLQRYLNDIRRRKKHAQFYLFTCRGDS